MIVYDALFLAPAEDVDTLVVTADGKLLKALENTSHAQLAHPLSDAGSSFPPRIDDLQRTATVLQPVRYAQVRGGRRA